MKILVFDTETTGFINKKDTNLENQPYIIQFAGIIGEVKNNDFTEEKRINILIKPPISIPFASSQVHHLYDIDVKDKDPIEKSITSIIEEINKVDVIIGHNIEYDEDMIKLELKRLGREHEYKPKQKVCTMKQTVDFCQIKGNGERFKYPKLGELYKKLFGEFFLGAHDAMVDVEATLKVFMELNKLGVIEVKEKKQEVLSLF